MQFTPGCKFIVDVEPLKHDLLQENRVCFSISRTPPPFPYLSWFWACKAKGNYSPIPGFPGRSLIPGNSFSSKTEIRPSSEEKLFRISRNVVKGFDLR